MHGVIFQELKEFTRQELGHSAWEDVCHQAGVAATMYASVQSYPDSDFKALTEVIAKQLDVPLQSLLEKFGRALVPGFMNDRAYLIDTKWDMLDLIEHLPHVLNKIALRQSSEGFRSFLRVKRDRADQVTVHYDSALRLCGLLKGAIEGLARRYRCTVEVSEPRCMLDGQFECELVIKVLSAEPKSPRPLEIEAAPH